MTSVTNMSSAPLAQVTLHPIATVRGGRSTDDDDHWGGVISTIELDTNRFGPMPSRESTSSLTSSSSTSSTLLNWGARSQVNGTQGTAMTCRWSGSSRNEQSAGQIGSASACAELSESNRPTSSSKDSTQ